MRSFTSAMGFLPECEWRDFSVTTENADAAQIKPNILASTLTRSGVTATFTASAAHRLLTGQTVTITGSTLGAYNGTFAVTVTGATTFTYTMLSDPGGNESDVRDIVCTYCASAQRAIVMAAANNAAALTIGPNVNGDTVTLAAGAEYLIENPHGSRFNLANWYMKAGELGGTITVLFV